MGTDDQDQFGKGDGDVSVDHFDEKIVEAAKPTSNDVDKPGAGEVDSDDDHFSTCFAELEEAGDIAELEGDIAELEEAGLLPDTRMSGPKETAESWRKRHQANVDAMSDSSDSLLEMTSAARHGTPPECIPGAPVDFSFLMEPACQLPCSPPKHQA